MFLHDHLHDLPGLVRDVELLKDSEEARNNELTSRIMECLRSLYEWRTTLEENNPNSCTEFPNSSKESEPLFPVMLHFSSFRLANEITTYDAILLLLLRSGTQIMGHNFDASIAASRLSILYPLPQSALLLPGSVGSCNARAVALEICRSIEFHLLGEKTGAGAYFLLFPLRLAYQNFEKGSRVSRWLEGVMARVADSSGFEIGRALGGKEVTMSVK